MEAGRRGRFSLVVGVHRSDQAAALVARRADLVVDDLGRLDIRGQTVSQGGR